MIASAAWFCFCLALGIGSVKVAAIVVVARRRRKHQRCLWSIDKLEHELGYKQAKPDFTKVRYHDPADLLELRPGAAWPTYINAGQMAVQQQQTYANTTLAKLLYEMRGAGRSEDSL